MGHQSVDEGSLIEANRTRVAVAFDGNPQHCKV